MIKKRKKRIIIPFFSLMLAVILTFFMGCSCFGGNLREEGYFLIGDNGCTIFLEGLTNKGLEQEILVVPEYIDGQELEYLSTSGFSRNKIEELYGAENVLFNSKKLKRLYIPFDVRLSGDVNNVFDEQMAFAVFAVMRIENTEWKRFYGGNVKISSNQYFERYPSMRESGIYCHQKISEYYREVLPANVTYHYNYPTTKNGGIYWIDDYDGELISYIPKNPYRIGFAFGGWYKEPECINKWDFEKDIVPEKIYKNEMSDNVLYMYSELNLYAKWQKGW